MRPSRTSRAYAKGTYAGRPRDNNIYIGTVKRVDDAQKMGRLSLWIPEIGGDPNDESSWIIASYASPFAGASDPAGISKSDKTMDGSQTSYGFWSVPPHVNNEVLVCFVNGDTARAFWFACLFQQNMNHMVPGVACNNAIKGTTTTDVPVPPVAEYNKINSASPNNPPRPTFAPLANGMVSQGLGKDYERGPGSTSARRESPSQVYGLSSPRGNAIHIDDDPESELIRIRSRSGAQILIHETTGYVYINSKLGNSWVEVSDRGVDVYSKGPISMRSEGDINLRADKNILLDAGAAIAMRAGTSFTAEAGTALTLVSATDSVMQSGGKLAISTTGDFLLYSDSNIRTQSTVDTTSSAGGNNQRSAVSILDNSGTAPDVTLDEASVPVAKNLDGQVANSSGAYGAGFTSTIVSRMPAHEPWSGHPKSSVPPPAAAETGEQVYARLSSYGTRTNSGQLSGTSLTSSSVRTGEGPVKVYKDSAGDTLCDGAAGTKPMSDEAFNALTKAASATGVPFGQLAAFSDVESNNGVANYCKHDAQGMFQFLSGTWAGQVRQYGDIFNVGQDDIHDLTANATMGGTYIQDNMDTAQAKGLNTDTGTLYLMHMLGPTGAQRFIAAAQSNPDTPCSTAYPLGSAFSGNLDWFAVGGQPRTLGDAYHYIVSTMNAKESAYDKMAGIESPCAKLAAAMTAQTTAATAADAVKLTTPSSGTVTTNEVGDAMTRTAAASVPGILPANGTTTTGSGTSLGNLTSLVGVGY